MLTEQQVKGQLKRLKIFGNLDESEFLEYYRVLKNNDIDLLSQSIDSLIESFNIHRFPLPSEIIREIRCISMQRKNEENLKKISGYKNTVNATAAFASAFRYVWFIKDEQTRKYFWENRLAIPETYTEQQQIDHYNNVRNEIIDYLRNNGVIFNDTAETGTNLVPEIDDDQLPF